MGEPGTLREVLKARFTEIADAVASAVDEQDTAVQQWRGAPPEQLRAERARLLAYVLDLSASGEESFRAVDLQRGRARGALFADHQIPLSVMLASFDVGIAALTRQLWLIAPPEYFAEMTLLTGRISQMIEQGYQAAVSGYLEARAGAGGRAARRALAEALIRGEAAAATQASGEPLAASYVVTACTVTDPATVSAEQVDQVEQYLEAIPGALYDGDLSALVILLPAGDSQPLPEVTAASLHGQLGSVSGQLAYAVQARGSGLAGIPAAAEETRRALPLVKAIPDGGSRPYWTDMLLVEMAVSRQPDIRERLVTLLGPLGDGPDLYRTLDVLFACDLDRDRTAGELGIHRRTLHYRLDRIRQLSGIDPGSTLGIQLLRAALTASRLPPAEQPARAEQAEPPRTA